ncbi:Uma2 family endonuclease [Streptosporangium sp. NPDC002544]|uniref:Uma2 family endonuclease n=1 Tax=Streptosporangium sp. NPDC002544 TaxID=3154538 RepID=UPI0033227CE5
MVVDAEAADDDDRTFYTPGEVHLAIEVVSPESEDRDRKTKPFRYAEAGIPHFWRVENNNGSPVVHVYELDPATRAYSLTGIHHDHLTVPVPFVRVTDFDSDGGRGLLLVEAMATAWGTHHDPEAGTAVWFHLPTNETNRTDGPGSLSS